jgi:hypothetical protein
MHSLVCENGFSRQQNYTEEADRQEQEGSSQWA